VQDVTTTSPMCRTMSRITLTWVAPPTTACFTME
jgi:hypothetical protein